MTSCPHCGSVKVTLVRAKGGYEYLCNLGGPHRFTCTVNKKARPKKSTAQKELESLGMTPDEAKSFISKHQGLSGDDLLVAALKEKGAPDGSD